MLTVEGKILKEALKRPGLDAVAFVKGFWVAPLTGSKQLWIVTEQESGWHLYHPVSPVVPFKLSNGIVKTGIGIFTF